MFPLSRKRVYNLFLGTLFQRGHMLERVSTLGPKRGGWITREFPYHWGQ